VEHDSESSETVSLSRTFQIRGSADKTPGHW